MFCRSLFPRAIWSFAQLLGWSKISWHFFCVCMVGKGFDQVEVYLDVQHWQWQTNDMKTSFSLQMLQRKQQFAEFWWWTHLHLKRLQIMFMVGDVRSIHCLSETCKMNCKSDFDLCQFDVCQTGNENNTLLLTFWCKGLRPLSAFCNFSRRADLEFCLVIRNENKKLNSVWGMFMAPCFAVR